MLVLLLFFGGVYPQELIRDNNIQHPIRRVKSKKSYKEYLRGITTNIKPLDYSHFQLDNVDSSGEFDIDFKSSKNEIKNTDKKLKNKYSHKENTDFFKLPEIRLPDSTLTKNISNKLSDDFFTIEKENKKQQRKIDDKHKEFVDIKKKNKLTEIF